jgi:hypothetical protein
MESLLDTAGEGIAWVRETFDMKRYNVTKKSDTFGQQPAGTEEEWCLDP